MAVVDEEDASKPANVRLATRTGMGSSPFEGGVAFRVWAPNAETVDVSGNFDDRSESRNPLAHEGNGYWSGEVSEAGPGDKYEYLITYQRQQLRQNDPYGHDVESSVGRTVIVDPAAFAWDDDGTFQISA